MGFERVALCVAAAVAGLLVGVEVQAQASAGPKSYIYSCVHNGKRLTRDRQIAECDLVEQRVMNSDGSLHHIIPPTLTETQRQELEACDREAEADRVARREAQRRDRNMLQTFPDEATHRKGREKSVDDSRNSVRNLKERIEMLQKDRKPLLDEAEFYVGKPLPLKLKQALDANDAALAAQRSLLQSQEDEVKRINDRYDVELTKLRKLWSGSPTGSFYQSVPLSPGCVKAAAR
jgi:hypothetical protein